MKMILTDLSETPQLSEDERWMEVARIAFPKQSSNGLSTASKAAAVSAMCISLKSLAGAALGNLSKIIFGLANYPSHKPSKTKQV